MNDEMIKYKKSW